MKTLLATLVLLLLMLPSPLKAQEKYEYAVISYVGLGGRDYIITVSKNNSYEEIKDKISEGTIVYNLTPLISKAIELNREGWEVYNTQIAGGPKLTTGHFYYLRRKIE